MKFLVDMNVSPAWVRFLAEAGFEAVHWSQIGRGDAPDSDVMRWAVENKYVILTSDLDFGAILAATRDRGPSVLQMRSDLLTPDALGSVVLGAIRTTRQQLSEGALVTIEPARARLRMLPLNE